MALELRDCRFTGPALPEPFVQSELEAELTKRKLLPKTTGTEGQRLQQSWEVYRRILRELVYRGGSVRVRNRVLEPLVERLGYERIEKADDVQTREGIEAGGHHLANGEARLRVWSTDLDIDLDAPAKRGAAYRYSHVRIAQRVLLTAGERIGLITNGAELRILISDPARPDSQIEIPIDPHWKRRRDVPDSFRVLVALASPEGQKALPEIVDQARLQQTKVTKELRVQARQAVERFVQELLDNPANGPVLDEYPDRQELAKQLWHEGLIVVYRLLFILKLESTDDPARSFSFASTSLWRNTFSPAVALAPRVRDVLDKGAITGRFLEDGLRVLFRMFTEGLQCTELNVKPLGGALFGERATPIVSRLQWGERAVAYLLDRLLWTPKKRGREARERVHYGPLDVEDLGRVYEALLELEPGITTETMCRLRRQKLEVVVPAAQGQKYRPQLAPAAPAPGSPGSEPEASAPGHSAPENPENPPEASAPGPQSEPEASAPGHSALDDTENAKDDATSPPRGKKTKVEWIEQIPPGRFYLRVGLGRKSTGSYYTPHSFVRFLVQETLGPQVEERSPKDNPRPCALLELKVLDPAMGSGHFLVEAGRFLGEKMYEACRLCDERALELEAKAEKAKKKTEREKLLKQVTDLRQRVIDLPDPDDEIVRYLPSRSPEGEERGYSQQKALALCRRMVAVHCLYGVDKNPLAVELAKLSLWIEAHAEGMPLTFLDHRLVVGDSLTGPFFDKLKWNPGDGEMVGDLFRQNLDQSFTERLRQAIQHVHLLEASVGVTLAEMEDKRRLKAELDRALRPFRIVAAAWSGGVMLGLPDCDDAAYADLMKSVGETGDLPERIESERLRNMMARGLGVDDVPPDREQLYALLNGNGPTPSTPRPLNPLIPALPYDLTFPEVFYPTGVPFDRQGFDAVLGNPPWDKVRPSAKEFFAAFDFAILAAPTKRERTEIERRLRDDARIERLHRQYEHNIEAQHRCYNTLYVFQVAEVDGHKTGGDPDLAKLFLERKPQLLQKTGRVGLVVPSAFHANEGATGIRRLYLERMSLECCYSFENRRKLFEIHLSFKFATVVAAREGPTDEFVCGFYLHDDEWLFGDREGRQLRYDSAFVRQTGGPYLTMLELRSAKDLDAAVTCYSEADRFESFCDGAGILLGRELHMTDDAWRFVATSDILQNDLDPRTPDVQDVLRAAGYLVLHEGKTFWHFNDRWGKRPRYVVPMGKLQDRRALLRLARFFRLAFRDVASSTNERTGIFATLPPGVVCTNKAPCDRRPEHRPNWVASQLMALANSFPFDFLLRLKVQATVNLFILNNTALPKMGSSAFLAHSAIRLTCNHSVYEPLWREQLGDEWREDKPPFTWPVLEGDDARWAVRAAIDAVVADAYGLSREQYAHVLSTFSHASYPLAPELCLARFDELHNIGLEAFTKKHDPYWDIPLNENLPQPVIDLPIPAPAGDNQLPLWEERDGPLTTVSPGPLFDDAPPAPKKTRRRRPPAGRGPTDFDPEHAYRELLDLLRNQRLITSSDARHHLGATPAQVRPLLKHLLKEGHAVTEGQRRGTRYLLARPK